MNNFDLCINAMTNKSLSSDDVSELNEVIQDKSLDCRKYKNAVFRYMNAKQEQFKRAMQMSKPEDSNNIENIPQQKVPLKVKQNKYNERKYMLVSSRPSYDAQYKICTYKDRKSGAQKEITILKKETCQSVIN